MLYDYLNVRITQEPVIFICPASTFVFLSCWFFKAKIFYDIEQGNLIY